MKWPSTLFQYVSRCVSVTLVRASLPRFAHDLYVRHPHGDMVRFASQSSAAVRESASLEAAL